MFNRRKGARAGKTREKCYESRAKNVVFCFFRGIGEGSVAKVKSREGRREEKRGRERRREGERERDREIESEKERERERGREK